MSDDYDGFVNCPNCESRELGPQPSAHPKQHLLVCGSCKCAFVVQDFVKHYFVAAMPAPMRVGYRFRREDSDVVYTADGVSLTECQGWWVYGVAGEDYTHMPCKDALPA